MHLLDRWEEATFALQRGDGSWQSISPPERDLRLQHRIVYTCQVLRAVATSGRVFGNSREVGNAVTFLRTSTTGNLLFDIALKIPTFADLGLISDAEQLLVSLFDNLLPTGNVDFAYRTDGPTFNRLFVLECCQYFDMRRFGESTLQKYEAILDFSKQSLRNVQGFSRDVGHWLWQARLLLDANEFVATKQIHDAVDHLTAFLDAAPLWPAPQVPKASSATWALRSNEVISAHILYNLSFLAHIIRPDQLDRAIGSPLRHLIAYEKSGLWTCNTINGAYENDPYLSALMIRVFCSLSRRLPDCPLRENILLMLEPSITDYFLYKQFDPCCLFSEHFWNEQRMSELLELDIPTIFSNLFSKESIEQPKSFAENSLVWTIPILGKYLQFKRSVPVASVQVDTLDKLFSRLERVILQKGSR